MEAIVDTLPNGSGESLESRCKQPLSPANCLSLSLLQHQASNRLMREAWTAKPFSGTKIGERC